MNDFDQLTRREREVVSAILDGATTNRQIADVLVVSERTVQAHLSNIFTKLDVSNRTELVLLAERTSKVRQKADDVESETEYPEEHLFYLFRIAFPVVEMPTDVRERIRRRVMAAIREMKGD